MAARGMQRAQERIVALAGEGRDLVSLWRDTSEILMPVVPHYGGACWYTLDPASLLITSHFNDYMSEFPPEMLAHEYYGDDVNMLADVVRSPSGVSTLHEATGGDPSASPRWQMHRARRRPGADPRAAHDRGRCLGRPRPLSRDGRADVRP